MSEKVKEGLAAIAREVLQDVGKEAETIIHDAEKEAKGALRASKLLAETQYADLLAKSKATIESEKNKIHSLTEVESRNDLLQVKEKLVALAFEKSRVELAEFAKTEKYKSYLALFIIEAVEKIRFNDLTVSVNAGDGLLLQQTHLLQELGEKLHVKLALADEFIECLGGCRIQTVDKKKTVDNTFEARLEQLKPELRLKLAAILFAKEENKHAN